MYEDTTVVDAIRTEIHLSLDELARRGAQRMLKQLCKPKLTNTFNAINANGTRPGGRRWCATAGSGADGSMWRRSTQAPGAAGQRPPAGRAVHQSHPAALFAQIDAP